METIFSVSELTDALKDIIEGSFDTITLEGEISNWRPAASGHCYFTLKDAHAAISAVMFKGKAHSLSFTPEDGMLVQASGNLSLYAQRGQYQIIVENMRMAGAGAILQMLEERKKALAAEGLFDAESKKKLPFFPFTIGVVTSHTGAVIRDILQITRRRNPRVSVLVLPCAVQGTEAGRDIAGLIRAANAYALCDVLIVGRGGGSLEDLLPFSEEDVVRAISESAIPVISAVGHEIDWALTDFAADVRAPTPSAAAELAVPELNSISAFLAESKTTFANTMHFHIEHIRSMLAQFSTESLELLFRRIEQPILQSFDDAKEDLLANMQELTATYRRKIESCVKDLEGANPKAILARGYAMVRHADSKKNIHRANEVHAGTKIEVIPAEGVICATVESVSG
ncbi:MAG: exodeoxyribonuclease VII large subunit [Treponemataceae bacterium]|nr:MAG: exodeoxyribonuclease VII large subunit [Treponemataceae bacterium]